MIWIAILIYVNAIAMFVNVMWARAMAIQKRKLEDGRQEDQDWQRAIKRLQADALGYGEPQLKIAKNGR